MCCRLATVSIINPNAITVFEMTRKSTTTLSVSVEMLNSFDLAQKLMSARGGFKSSTSEAVRYYWMRFVLPQLNKEVAELKRKRVARQKKVENATQQGELNQVTQEGINLNIRQPSIDGSSQEEQQGAGGGDA